MKEAEFAVGDTVVIKRDLLNAKRENSSEYCVVPEMTVYEGKSAIIRKVEFTDYRYYYYRISIDGEPIIFYWHDYMFEPKIPEVSMSDLISMM